MKSEVKTLGHSSSSQSVSGTRNSVITRHITTARLPALDTQPRSDQNMDVLDRC